MNQIRMIAVGLVLFCCSLMAGDSDIPDSVGYVEAGVILSHYPALQDNYDRYSPTPSEISDINLLEGKDLLVMFGTWCHDSEREIPRLLKLLDVSDVELKSLTLLAVDKNKQEPTGKAKRWRLKYTPTIVVTEGEKELGRIIEKPRVSLASDLADIVNQ